MTTSRRRFLKLTAGGIVGLGVGGFSLRAFASEQVNTEDAQAKAMQYVHKSAKAGQTCGNCMLIQGNANETWRPCGLFPGKLVNNDGWCLAWTKLGE